jgi:hypothetical protein
MRDPDIEFHRFFNRENLKEEEYKRHPAKLDLDKIDPNLAQHLAAIKKLINDMFAVNTNSIQTPFGPVALHLDYIAKPLPPIIRFANAISFTDGEFFYVGVTIDMVELLNTICGSLAQSLKTIEVLGLKAENSAQRDVLLACLFLVQIQFIIDHEIGHHFHGHSTKRGPMSFNSEFTCEPPSEIEEYMKNQGREVDADGYAIHMMAGNFYQQNPAAKLIEQLGPSTLSHNEFLTRFLLLCIASFFILRPQNRFDAETVRNATHPFGTMRLNVVMTDFAGWADQFKPDLLPYLTQATLDHLNAAIQTTSPDSENFQSWALEGQFLRTDKGEAYRTELYEFRKKQREQFKDRAWGIRKNSAYEGG